MGGYFSTDPSTMPSRNRAANVPRCVRLFACWTGCMGSILPCMAAQPPQMPINDPISIPSVGDSIPKRDSYDTDEEYHIALTTWKREGVNHITSHIQSHVLSGTMTPELMERFNSEIEKINFL